MIFNSCRTGRLCICLVLSLGLLLAPVPLSAGTPPPPPPSSSPPEAGRELIAEPIDQIPFQVVRNRVVLPIGIGKSAPLDLTLDTGMTIDGIYLFHKEAEGQIGDVDFIDVRVPGAGSGEPSHAIMADSLTLHCGSAPFKNQMVIISTSDRTQSFPSQGVIGATLFQNFVVELDYDQKILKLYDPDTFAAPPSWERIDITLQKKIPFLDAAVSVDGEEVQPIRAYIDLAAEEALLLLLREGGRFSMPDGAEERYIGTGLSGDIHGGFGRVRTLRLGSFELCDVVTAFAPAEVRSKQKGADAILGNNLIRRFHAIFDYSRGALYLKPGGDFKAPFEEL